MFFKSFIGEVIIIKVSKNEVEPFHLSPFIICRRRHWWRPPRGGYMDIRLNAEIYTDINRKCFPPFAVYIEGI